MPIPNLPQSQPSTTFLSSSTFGSVLYGTAGNDQLTANAGRVALDGGAGDDIYYLFKASANYSRSNTQVVEYANAGIDTIYTPSSYVLPWMVENLYLTSTGASRYAFGNDGNNILSSGVGNDYLITGGGNDVLFGGAGVDMFTITKASNTTSWVADFEAGVDRLNLTTLGFKSFAQVLAATSQVGPDLKITAASGQKIMLANATAASLDAAHVIVDTPSTATGAFRQLTFSDEFNGPLSLNTGVAPNDTGTWRTFFYNGDRRIYGNNDLQYYVDPDAKGKGGVPLNLNPFVVEDGILHIQARPTDPAMLPALWNVPYTSGMLTTQFSFQQQYGYFEIRAQDPFGKGMFPAFWMLPVDKSWPPEIDIYEQVGSQVDYVSQGVASAAQPTANIGYLTGVDMTKAFHTYGMEWTAQKITWFIDGVQTFQVNTPGDLHKPMYLIVNLAVGGNWPGTPDSTVDWTKADLLVDYIRAYRLDEAPPSPPSTLQVVLSHAGNAFDLSDSFTLPAGTPGTSTTFTGADMQIVGVADTTTVTATYSANGDLILKNNSAWDAIKNATVKDTAVHGIDIRNFVDVEITLGSGNDSVAVTSAKRGTITTNGGDDTVTVAGTSNNTSSNILAIRTGAGNDTITFDGGNFSRFAIDASSGNDVVTVSGQSYGSIVGGIGNDLLVDKSSGSVTMTGGTGADIFGFAAGVKATVGDFVAGTDQIQLIGVSAAQVTTAIVGADTQISINGASAIKLIGVTLTQAELDIHYV